MEILVPSILNILTALVCLSLGALVLVRNPRRVTNVAFSFLASILMLWAIGVFLVIQSTSEAQVILWVHFTEFVICFAPAAFYHFVGFFPRGRFNGSRKFLFYLYLSGIILAAASMSPNYIQEITLFPDKPPRVAHSIGLAGPIINMFIGLIAIHNNLWRKLGVAQGFGRRQIQFVLTGHYCVAAVSILVVILEPLFNTMRLQAYGPVCVMLFMTIFTYAMVKYHLLETRAFVSRVLVYIGSTAFVIGTFIFFMILVEGFDGSNISGIQLVPAILTGLVVSLVFQTVKNKVENFIEVTLLRQRYDIDALYARLTTQAAEVVHLDDFLKNISTDIQEIIGVRIIRVLLLDPNDKSLMVGEFTTVPNEAPFRSREQGVLLDYLRERPYPLILEQILHSRPDERMVRIASALAELDAFFCLPLNTSDGLVGIMTLGQKDTHDIYSEKELIAFRALAGPLGTAVANARLYCALENVHTHQSNVFSQMREGVIAVDHTGKVTTTNEAALNLMGEIEVGQDITELPHEIANLLTTTLDRGVPVSDYQITLTDDEGDPVPVIVSSSCLKTNDSESTGAVALIYDLSQVKRLERNVQRADRLSSIGTLAAGMAHEIKNPLVSIKTFTQLLSDRYKDPDFRSTFEEVVPSEVERIDTIVSRLLEFARPRPVRYQPLPIRQVIDQVLALVENQTRKGFISIDIDFPQPELFIHGDEQQLHQVFLNLILNAADAMKDKHEGIISIKARSSYLFQRKRGSGALMEKKCARITVHDTGMGIASEKIQELFTPFYTTKDDGCGLGLAVVHSIITEHGGEIDVSSVPGEGTTFTVSIPMANIDAEVQLHPA